MRNHRRQQTAGRNLGPAHRGYHYQDVTAAYALAQALVSGSSTVTVDRKLDTADPFDDLRIHGSRGEFRRQIKWSDNQERELLLRDFTGSDSSLRIDRLVQGALIESGTGSPECRLALAWHAPSEGELRDALLPHVARPTIPGSRTLCFRVDHERIWPATSGPTWDFLENVSRADFYAFAERFIIETQCPAFSGDLSAPGELEQRLIAFLRERIGIGFYPNIHRTPEDVAARLIAVANEARTKHSTLTAAEIAHKIDLQIDFGRVAQQFPVSLRHRVNRRRFTRKVASKIRENSIVQLVGPPGSGKSWEINRVVSQLRREGHLVAHHYCYLEPGDLSVEQRVTTNTLFANLIADLVDSDPSLVQAKSRRFAADADELQRILEVACQKAPGKAVILVVDGLDHIARVRAESSKLSAAETNVIEELAALILPAGANLLIASQPGEHLDPFHEAGVQIDVPAWTEDELWEMATRHGLAAGLKNVAVEPGPIRIALAERAEGNPLYCTFLVRGMLSQLNSGDNNPLDWLAELPKLSGDIETYYRYLYGDASAGVGTVADILGLVDFALSPDDICEILGPVVARHVPQALRQLHPILIDVAGQGGVRVFHESFRRFVRERICSEGTSLESIIAPVVQWLEQRGFFADSKAYRFLLPTLARAGMNNQILRTVTAGFVSDSLANGHPKEAVERNLVLATHTAAEDLAWADLVRCTELRSAFEVCYDDDRTDSLGYWRTYLSVFSAKQTAQRMVYDGRPTLSKHLGLVLCSLLEDHGITAPWQQYFSLPRQPFEDKDDAWVGSVLAAVFHGWLLTHKEHLAIKKLEQLFVDDPGRDSFARPAMDRLVRTASKKSVDKICGGDTRLPLDVQAQALLARAALADQTNPSDANRAVELSPYIDVAAEAARLGLSVLPSDMSLPEPASLDVGLHGEIQHVDEGPLRAWIDTVMVLGVVQPEKLNDVEAGLAGEGFYRAWLRFVVLTARATYAERTNVMQASKLVAEGFKDLATNAAPFRGNPRAVDLSAHRHLVRGSLDRALSLLQSEEDWIEVISALEVAISGTSASIKGAPWGPILRETFGELLLPYAHTPALQQRICEAAATQVTKAQSSGEYFSNISDIEFTAANVMISADRGPAAQDYWVAGCDHLCGYGFRKDYTLHQLLNALPAFASDPDLTLDLVEQLFPLAERVLAHTDGKGTRGLLNACVRAIADVDPGAALSLVGRSLAANGGTVGTSLENALCDVLQRCVESADPRLLVCAWNMVKFDFEDERSAQDELSHRLAAIEDLNAKDKHAAAQALERLAARVEGDPRVDATDLVWPLITEAAGRMGVIVGRPTVGVGTIPAQDRRLNPIRRDRRQEVLFPPTLPPPTATALDLMSWIRDNNHFERHDDGQRTSVVNRLGYRCVELAQTGKADTAVRLVRYFARELLTLENEGAVVLAELGAGFERFAQPILAAVAYSLAFARSRSAGGWFVLGDDRQVPWFTRARKLDNEESCRTLASEAAHFVDRGYTNGVTPGLVRIIASWGDLPLARKCWEQAYLVIDNRLKSDCTKRFAILPFRRAETPRWTIDESLVGLMLGRLSHPEFDRKRSALLAFAQAIRCRPDAVASPVMYFLARDGAPTSGRAILQTLAESDLDSELRSRLIPILELISGTPLYGESFLAQRLLGDSGTDTGLDVVTEDCGEVSARHRAAALSLDWGDRVDQVSILWPSFADDVAGFLQRSLFEVDSAKERARHRYDFARIRGRSMEYWTPVLGWEQELFEQAMHAALAGVTVQLRTVAQGTLDHGLFLELVLPRLRAAIGSEASRTVRPAIKRPSDTVSFRGSLPLLPHGDPLAGWSRLALYEEELVFNSDETWHNPAEVVVTAAGVVAGSLKQAEVDKVPLGICTAEDCAPKQGDLRQTTPGQSVSVRGPVVASSIHKDLFGELRLLAFPQVLAERYNLRVGPWTEPVCWVDDDQKPVVKLRTWRVRGPHYPTGEEPSILSGCEIVVHPDVLAKLESDSRGELEYLVRIVRTPVDPGEEE